MGYTVAIALAVIVMYCAGHAIGRRSALKSSATGRPSRGVNSTDLRNQGPKKRSQFINSLLDDVDSLFFNCTSVSTYMTTDLAIVTPQTPLDDAVQVMIDRGVRHLLVCEKGDRLLGIISDRDLRTREGRSAGEVMTRSPETVSESTSMVEAVEILLDRNFSCLPVCRGTAVCGLITTTDVILALQCTFGVLRRVAEDAKEPVGG